MKKISLILTCSVVAGLAQGVVTNVTQIGGDGDMRDSGWTALVTTNSAVSPVEYSMSWGADAKYTELSNVVFTVTAQADNALDVLFMGSGHMAVDSSARQLVDTNNTSRLNLDESITLKFSYSDPDGTLLGLKMDSIAPLWNTGGAEETLFTDGSAVYAVTDSDNDALFDYDSTGLAQLSLSNTNTWFMQVYQTNDLTTSGMGAFRIEYIADSDYVEPVTEGLRLDGVKTQSDSLTGANGVLDLRNSYDVTDSTTGLPAPLGIGDTFEMTFEYTVDPAGTTVLGQKIGYGTAGTNGWAGANALKIGFCDGTNAVGFTLDLTDYIQKIELAADLTCTGPGTLGLGDNKTGEIKADNTKNTDDEMRYAGDTATFDVSIFHDAAGIYDLTVLWGTATNSHSITNAGLLMSEVNLFIVKADNPTADMGFTVTMIDPPAAPPVAGYGTWLDTYPTLGSLTNHTDDAENGGVGDGMNNLLEYALGGDPTDDDAAMFLPVENVDATYLNYVYRRRTDAATRGLTYDVYSTLDLVIGPMTNATEEVVGVDLGGGFESVTNRVPIASEAKQFMGLEVEISE